MNKEYPSLESVENSCVGYFLKQIPLKTSVLEFGAASGYMTRYLKEERNCAVTCIEINPESAMACEPYASQIIISDIDSGSWCEGLKQKYDYILFADVLEHLKDPEVALTRALCFLAPQGVVITSIPNIAHNAILLSLFKGCFEYTEYGLLDDTHIHFFTRKSMTEMFGRVGLFCTGENSSVRRPGTIAVREFYCTSPILSLLILRRSDAHTYQFVCKWERTTGAVAGKLRLKNKIPIYYLPYLLCLDFKDYLYHQHNIDCIRWLRKRSGKNL